MEEIGGKLRKDRVWLEYLRLIHRHFPPRYSTDIEVYGSIKKPALI